MRLFGVQMHVFAWYSGLAFVVLASLLSFWQVYCHLQYNKNDLLRKYVLRILFMVPIYAIESWMGLRYTSYHVLWEVARDLYEAFVIFSFYMFLMDYLGGEPLLAQVLNKRPPQKHVFPLSCFSPWTPASRFVRLTKLGTLQYVLVKLLCTIVEVTCNRLKIPEEFSFSSPYVYTAILGNASQVWAMYCLVLLYVATKDLLEPIRPVPKFLCIKSVVFFTYWQSLLIKGLAARGIIHQTVRYTTDNVSAGVQDYIICIEMFFAAIAHSYAFPVSDFDELEETSLAAMKKRGMLRKLLSAANMTDVIREARKPHASYDRVPEEVVQDPVEECVPVE